MIAHVFKAAPRANSPTQPDAHHVPLDVELASTESIVSHAHPHQIFKEQFVKVTATQDTSQRATSANNVIMLVQVALELLEPNVDHAMTDSS